MGHQKEMKSLAVLALVLLSTGECLGHEELRAEGEENILGIQTACNACYYLTDLLGRGLQLYGSQLLTGTTVISQLCTTLAAVPVSLQERCEGTIQRLGSWIGYSMKRAGQYTDYFCYINLFCIPTERTTNTQINAAKTLTALGEVSCEVCKITAWSAINSWDDPNLIIEDHCAGMFGESEDFKTCMKNLAKYNVPEEEMTPRDLCRADDFCLSEIYGLNNT